MKLCNFLVGPERVCGKPEWAHVSSSHEFTKKPKLKAHIEDVAAGWAMCGRRVPDRLVAYKGTSYIRKLGLRNELCLTCFNKYLVQQTRDVFLHGARSRLWAVK